MHLLGCIKSFEAADIRKTVSMSIRSAYPTRLSFLADVPTVRQRGGGRRRGGFGGGFGGGFRGGFFPGDIDGFGGAGFFPGFVGGRRFGRFFNRGFLGGNLSLVACFQPVIW